MSTSHHSSNRDPQRLSPELEKMLQRFDEQLAGRNANREYPHGRMGLNDEGSLTYAIGHDPKHGTVIIDFGKPVEWIGLEPKDVVTMVKALVDHARQVSKEPLEFVL